jgi:hypothetical protein
MVVRAAAAGRARGRAPNLRTAARRLAGAAGLAGLSYALGAATSWCRYGRVKHLAEDEGGDALLDRFLPVYEVVERHRTRVGAPAAITFAAACEMDLTRSAIVRGIFKSRERILGSHPEAAPRPRGLVAMMKDLGWGVLAEVPDREIVVGAVTQPWQADVVFRALPPDEFAAFREPGWVKIAWTLRADPRGEAASIARTETRVATTDPAARAKFRRYWALFSPGIVLIRRISLRQLRTEAESRARSTKPRHVGTHQ